MSAEFLLLFIVSNIMGYGSLFLVFKGHTLLVAILGALSYFSGLFALCKEENFVFRDHRMLLGGPVVGFLFSIAGFVITIANSNGDAAIPLFALLYIAAFAVLTFLCVKFLWVKKD